MFITMITNKIKLLLPDFSDLVTHILHLSGYPSPKRVEKIIRKEMEASVEKVLACLEPKSIYRVADFEKCENGIIEGKELHIRSDKLSNLVSNLNDPESITCFAVTLGLNLDDRIREIQNHSMTQAFFMDAAGSAIVEIFASLAESRIQTLLVQKNLAATERFSPGYCDWDLRCGQDTIHQFLMPECIGIRKYPSGMMIPEKTITAVVIGARSARFKNPCSFCKRTECAHRRDGLKPKKQP